MPEVQSPDSDTSSPDRRGSDLTEPFRLREYAPGDSLRQIHWKLSSKLDRLVIREPGMPAARTLLVFWDRSGECRRARCAGGGRVLRLPEPERAGLCLSARLARGRHGPLCGGWLYGGAAAKPAAAAARRRGASAGDRALRGFGKILYFTASPDPVWRSLTAGAESVLLLCGVPEQPDVRCICYTKEDYAAALQQLEL